MKECEKKKIEDNDPHNDDNWVPSDVLAFHKFRPIIVPMIFEINITLIFLIT